MSLRALLNLLGWVQPRLAAMDARKRDARERPYLSLPQSSGRQSLYKLCRHATSDPPGHKLFTSHVHGRQAGKPLDRAHLAFPPAFAPNGPKTANNNSAQEAM